MKGLLWKGQTVLKRTLNGGGDGGDVYHVHDHNHDSHDHCGGNLTSSLMGGMVVVAQVRI